MIKNLELVSIASKHTSFIFVYLNTHAANTKIQCFHRNENMTQTIQTTIARMLLLLKF